MQPKPIVIFDFGSQYTQLIARRIREQNVLSIVLPCTASFEEVNSSNPSAIILSGGPSSVYDEDAPPFDDRILDLSLPTLGICYGFQYLAHKFGGKVRPAVKREYGQAEVEVTAESALFSGLPPKLKVWMSHGDEVLDVPSGFGVICKSGSAIAGMEDERRKVYSLQFHPEVNHTPSGTQILRNFLFNICDIKPNWTPQQFIDDTLDHVNQLVGEGRAICALSGGVDSAVAATLVARAIGSRLTCIFVNTGMLRKNEFEKVQEKLRGSSKLNVIGVDAAKQFLHKLKGVVDPEKKRRIIGNEFIAVFDEQARRIEEESGKVEWLVQGTLYPDVIESRSVRGPSQTIKTHHNVGGLPEKMNLKLIEPLKNLFKDEVRRIGRDLNMPDEILRRQPFPGPGLAVRILGEVTPERIAIVQEADDIVVSEIKKAGLYTKVWQSFAVLLPIKSVGVMGDQRTYAYTCALRVVNSDDGMTADWVNLPHETLKVISNRIVNEVKGINRVVYDITSKPPGTIEWE